MEQIFEFQPELTGIALAYRNKKFIADQIFPKIPVRSESFQYNYFDKADFLTVPDTKIGKKGSPNSVDFTAKLKTVTVEDHAIKEETPVKDIEAGLSAKIPVNLKAVVAAQLTDTLMASREIAVANKLSNSANYGSNYKKLGADEKISASSTDALGLICDSIDSMFQKANTMILSRKASSALRRNPSIVGAVYKNSATSGIVSIEALKELFELDNIYVGETVVNTAKKGQTPVYGAAWKNDIVLAHINSVATTDYGITFGYQAVLEDIQIGTYFDPDKGLKGCEIQKAYTSYIDLITAPECGYLLADVI